MEYAVIKVNEKPSHDGCKIIQHSTNIEELQALKQQLKKEYPNDQIAVMTYSKARREKYKYSEWFIDYCFEIGWRRIQAEIKARGEKNQTDYSKYYGYSETGVREGSLSIAVNSLWG